MTPDEKDLKVAHDIFFDASNQMFTGELTLMKEVWSHGDDVIYMGPGGGYQVGWNAVLKDWEAQAAAKFGGKITTTDVHLAAYSSLGYIHSVETGENTNVEGHTEHVSIRATKIFRKEEGKWKLISLHTDLLPYVPNV